MKSIFLSLILTFAASNVDATTYLPEPARGQTGFYVMHQDGNIIDKAGLALEIFETGDSVWVSGLTLNNQFLFGAIYNSNNTFYTIAGELPRFTLPFVFSSDVFMLVDGQEVDVGNITLKFDPNLIGDAENIEYNLLVNGELTFGTLERISSTPIFACRDWLQFSPPNPYNNELCN